MGRARTRTRGSFDNFYREAPRWASSTYHVFRMVQVLEDFTRIAVSLASAWWRGPWVIIRSMPPAIEELFRFERFFERAEDRQRYNGKTLEIVRRTKKPVLGTFRGYRDLFVPVVRNGQAEAVLVAGPFLQASPSAEDVLERWVALRGQAADPFDPGLSAYARAELDVQVLAPRELAAFTELIEILARALGGTARQPGDLERLAELRERTFGRLPRSRQTRALAMVDPLLGHRSVGSLPKWGLAELGIERLPNTVIAAMPAEEPNRDKSVVDTLVAARTFQDRCEALCSGLPDTLTAPLESYGTYFLFHSPPRRNAAHRRLYVMDRARAIAQRIERDIGVRATVGIGGTIGAELGLAQCAHRAAIALQLATQQGAKLVAYDEVPGEWRGSGPSAMPAAHLERLCALFSSGMFAELEREKAEYVRAVLWESGGRTDRVRMHFEYAIDRLLATLQSHRDLDERALEDLRQRLREASAQATSSQTLATALGDALDTLVHVAGTPGQSQLKLKLARAARYIEEHCAEPLTLGQVARHVGLSRNYFCNRFRIAAGSGFADYLRRARVERAKHLLRYSSLPIARTGREAGFVSVPHFNRAFRNAAGMTPSEFRARYGHRAA
jgi:AraC-like DNA-binding protein